MAHICVDAVFEGESGAIEWKEYDGWGMLLPQGDFYFRTGDDASWAATLRRFGGPDVEAQWARLRDACDPVTSAAGATPPMVLRSDAWVALPVLRCLGGILQAATLGSGGCNPMWRRLQPHVAEAATPCSRAARAALPRRHPAGGASDS